MEFAAARGNIGGDGRSGFDFARVGQTDAKKNELKPWQVKEWVIPTADVDYVCAMEAVLDVYERPYDPNNPVVGLDESPKQLISQVRETFTDSKGVIYQDYEYRREGVADLYLAGEALAGRREIFVKDNHNRLSWAEVVWHIAEEMYPEAERITIVQDNLAAHKPSALYEIMPAEEARRILRRIEFVHTPKHGRVAQCGGDRDRIVKAIGDCRTSW